MLERARGAAVGVVNGGFLLISKLIRLGGCTPVSVGVHTTCMYTVSGREGRTLAFSVAFGKAVGIWEKLKPGCSLFKSQRCLDRKPGSNALNNVEVQIQTPKLACR